MIVRNFKLYLHAGATSPLVINANQYDHNEQWVFELYDSNNQKYTPSTGAIVGIKSDGLGIINTATVDSNGRVVVNETEQMTAAAGRAEFELMIDSAVHGTANFYVLVEPKPGDNADLSETDISMIEQAIEAASAIKPYGSPLVASTVAGMTDHEKVYVYVGSETGYTSGNWYYWDGSAWTSGGVYNSVAVQTDTTLTLSGVAADAKKTGDEISDLKSALSNFYTDTDLTDQYIENGYIPLAVSIGTTINTDSPTSSQQRNYIVVPCSKGDRFTITGTGGANPRLWGILDTSKVLLAVAQQEVVEANLEIEIEQDGYFVSNVYKSATYSLVHSAIEKFASKNDFDTLETRVDELETDVNDTVHVDAFKYGFANDLNAESLWEQGQINSTTGANSPSTATLHAYRIRTKTYIDSDIKKIVSTVGYFVVYTYNNGTFEGTSDYVQEYSDFDPSKQYRLIYSTANGSSGVDAVTPADYYKMLFLAYPLMDFEYRKTIAWGGSVPSKWYKGLGSDYGLFSHITTYDDFISAFNTLCANSNYVTVNNIGTSSDNKTMYAYEFVPTFYKAVDLSRNNKPPKMIIVSGQHGFEKSSCYGLYYFVRDLLNDYEKDEALSWIRSNLHLIIIPCANPYGFTNMVRKNANGVDLNRNWTPGFESGEDPSSAYYGGAQPFDQPETQAIKAVIDANTDALYLSDYHTVGEYTVANWNNVNWVSFNVSVLEDDYFINAYKAANVHVSQLTEQLLKEYSLDSDGSPLGSVTMNSTGGTVSRYALSVGVMGNTFEGFNGFPSDSEPYLPTEQKANSELICNWIKTLMATFRAID